MLERCLSLSINSFLAKGLGKRVWVCVLLLSMDWSSAEDCEVL